MDANAINTLLEVTSQDIAYFRRGELSPAVRKKQEDAERGCNRWIFYILLICIAADVAIVVFAKGDWEGIIAGGAVPTIFGVGALLLLIFGRTPLSDPENAKVRQVSGPAKLNISIDEGHKNYILVVEKADFRLSRELFEAIPEDAPIRVYYQKVGPSHNKMLAVESGA